MSQLGDKQLVAAIGFACAVQFFSVSIADLYGAKAMYVTQIAGMVLLVTDPFLIYYSGWGLHGAAAGLGLFVLAVPYIIEAFDPSGQGAEVLSAFALNGVGGFIFFGALFVSNAAFSKSGQVRALYAGELDQGRGVEPASGDLVCGDVWRGGGDLRAGGGGDCCGAVSATVGWLCVKGLRADVVLDPAVPAPYPNPDRHRSR